VKCRMSSGLKGLKLILASASPRRKELLCAAGLDFTVVPAEVDETIYPGETPQQSAMRLAQSKAQTVASHFPEDVVLAADTIVVLPDAGGGSFEILGKPQTTDEAYSMLEKLSGREHVVITAFSICCQSTGFLTSKFNQSKVYFRSLSSDEINAYIATGEPMDKAGGYGVQGFARVFISYIIGSYTNVMGLPLAEVIAELKLCDLWTPAMLKA
jgi:septum formation protein